MQMVMTKAKKPRQRARMGRPPGKKYERLLHVRVSDEMYEELDAIRQKVDPLNQPDMADIGRTAFSEFIARHKTKAGAQA